MTRRTVAAACGYTLSRLNNVLAGHQPPPYDLRKRMEAVLGSPRCELFTPEALARYPGRKYRAGSSVTAGDDIRPMRKIRP